MKPLTPIWARLLVLPAILFFMGMAGFLTWTAFSAIIKQGEWAALITIPLAGFMFYCGYRFIDLYRFRNVVAELTSDRLKIASSKESSPESYKFSALSINDHPNMQIVNIDHLETGRRLITIDYFYFEGMKMVHELQEKQQSKQCIAPTNVELE